MSELRALSIEINLRNLLSELGIEMKALYASEYFNELVKREISTLERVYVQIRNVLDQGHIWNSEQGLEICGICCIVRAYESPNAPCRGPEQALFFQELLSTPQEFRAFDPIEGALKKDV